MRVLHTVGWNRGYEAALHHALAAAGCEVLVPSASLAASVGATYREAGEPPPGLSRAAEADTLSGIDAALVHTSDGRWEVPAPTAHVAMGAVRLDLRGAPDALWSFGSRAAEAQALGLGLAYASIPLPPAPWVPADSGVADGVVAIVDSWPMRNPAKDAWVSALRGELGRLGLADWHLQYHRPEGDSVAFLPRAVLLDVVRRCRALVSAKQSEAYGHLLVEAGVLGRAVAAREEDRRRYSVLGPLLDRSCAVLEDDPVAMARAIAGRDMAGLGAAWRARIGGFLSAFSPARVRSLLLAAVAAARRRLGDSPAVLLADAPAWARRTVSTRGVPGIPVASTTKDRK